MQLPNALLEFSARDSILLSIALQSVLYFLCCNLYPTIRVEVLNNLCTIQHVLYGSFMWIRIQCKQGNIEIHYQVFESVETCIFIDQ